MALEANKKELGLSTNVFNKATEYQGKTAWFQLILNLIFLRPGTYPSIPNMGVGIQDYEYEYIDDVKDNIRNKIEEQVSLFLPDVPLASVEVTSVEYEGKTILLIVISLDDNGQIVTGAVASEITNRLIDFDISWN
nr:MAG TPA: Baseplate wedge protein [Caudoviricetes sp.]